MVGTHCLGVHAVAAVDTRLACPGVRATSGGHVGVGRWEIGMMERSMKQVV